MKRAAWLTLRLILGGLFIVAGLAKLRDPAAFATEVANYHLFSEAAPLLAATLPAVELVAGLALISGPSRWRRSAALLLSGLMVVFTAALTLVVVRGINISCGCFGGDTGPITWLTVARDFALLGVALALLFEPPTSRRE
jgi:uncharacterized membrane protein YphA (DoxX/SURF4 family)